MGVVVVFDPVAFAAAFPQFSSLTSTQLTTIILPIAEVYCRNDGGGPVSLAATQTALLNLMVAHVAALMFPPLATPAGEVAPVGRVASASQGSVSVSFDFPQTPNAAWFNQTQFGAAFWQATAAYRTMRYLPRPRRITNPWIPGV
jgi:hypothetical protein